MESNKSTLLRQSLRTALVRLALYVRQRCTLRSRIVVLFVVLYEGLQLASLALTQNYPWATGVSSLIWQALTVSGQPLKVIRDNGVPDYVILVIIGCTLGTVVLCLVYLSWLFSYVQDFEFQRLLAGKDSRRFQDVATYLILVVLTLFRLLFIPILAWLNGISSTEIWPCFIQAVFGIFTCVSSVYFTSYKLGSRSFRSMSTPYFALYHRLSYWFFVLGIMQFTYQDHEVLHELVYILSGSFWLFQVFCKLPFQQDALNQLEIAKSLFLVWTGVVLIVGNINALGGASMLTMHLVIYAGGLVVVFLTMQWYRFRILKKESVSYEFEFELRIRWHLLALMPEPKKDDQEIKDLKRKLDNPAIDRLCREAYKQFHSDPYILMCIITFYLFLKEKVFVKTVLRRLQTLDWNLFSFIDIGCCEFAVASALYNTKSDREAIQFMQFSKHIRSVKDEDERLCCFMVRMNMLFDQPRLDTSEVSRILKQFRMSLKSTKRMYRSLSQVIGDNPEFGLLYVGFLGLFDNHEKAKALEVRIKHIKEEMLEKYRAREETVYFFDQLNLVLLVSLEAKDMGIIIGSKGASILGYLDTELVDNNCNILIPEPIRSGHQSYFQQVFQFRHKHALFKEVSEAMVVTKEGFLQQVHWKLRLVSHEEGRLGVLLALRILEEADDFAIVFNCKIEQCTKGFALATKAGDVRRKLEECIEQKPIWKDEEVLLQISHGNRNFVFVWKNVIVHGKVSLQTIRLMNSQTEIEIFAPSTKSVMFDHKSIDSGTSKAEKNEDVVSSNTRSFQYDTIEPKLSKHFSTQKSAARSLRILMLLASVVGILGQLGTILDIQFQVTDLGGDIEIINEISKLRSAMELVGLDARELYLQTRGYNFSRDYQTVQADLQVQATLLSASTELLLTVADSGFTDVGQNNIGWWTLRGSKLEFSFKNAISLTGELTMYTHKLTASGTIDQGTVTELVRNTQAEALLSLDALIDTRITYHKANYANDRTILITPLFAVFYPVVFLLILASVAFLVQLGRKRRLIWSILAGVKNETLLTFHTSVIGRLENVHGVESVSLRQRHSRVLSYSWHPMQLLLWTLVIAIFALVIGLYQLNYGESFVPMQTTQFHLPLIVFTTCARKSQLASILFFMRELTLPKELQFHVMTPSNNQVSSPATALKDIFTLQNVQEKALRGQLEDYSSDWEVSQEHFAFLLETAIATSVPELHYGFTPALGQLNESVQACISNVEDGFSYSSSCTNVERAIFALLNETDTDQNYFITDSNITTNRAMDMAMFLIVISIAVLACFFLFVFLPISYRLVGICGQEVKLFGLLTSLGRGEPVYTQRRASTTVLRSSIS